MCILPKHWKPLGNRDRWLIHRLMGIWLRKPRSKTMIHQKVICCFHACLFEIHSLPQESFPAVLNHNVPAVLPEMTLIAKTRIFDSYTHSWWRHQKEIFSALLALCAGIDRSPVNSPHKGQWRGALILFLMGAWIHGWVNNREDADLRRHRAHHDVTGCNKRKAIVEIESLLYPLILWNLMQSPLWQI